MGTQTEDVTIPYEKSLTSYKSHTPANSYPGYYFAGWYLDQEGTKPFDLENMPAGNVIVYAKWNPKWYRIVVDYKRGNSSSVITVPGSTQKASFTVQYGSTILTSSLMQAQRMDLDGNDNWMLVGLYLDEACTQPFNQNMHAPFGLTEEQEVYPAGSRTGIDDITGETWSDEAYPDVRAKITLYAKWRVNPEGVVGIKVRYLGDHAENDKGYFDSNEKPHSMTLQNPVFTDGAKASAHSATVPALPDEDTPDVGRRFLYWEILDKYGNPTGEIVYPGSPFTIDINKAVEIKTPLPDPNCTHTNEGASTIASVAAVAPTCTGTGVAAHYKCTKCGRLFTDAAGTTETTLDALTVPATGHDWATNAPTYVWSVVTFDEYTVPTCTATVVCGNDETHVETETVTGQLVVNGTTGHYLAEFENPAFADQQSGTFTVSRIAVTYQANGETIDELTQLVTSGQTVTLPGSEYLPAFTGYTFVGWVQAAVSDTTNAPAYKAPGATSDPINGPTTFIALYTREQATGGNTTVYKRLTESPADWTGRYVITEGNTDELHALKTCGSGLYLQVADGAATLSDSGMTLIDSNTLSGPASDYLFNVSAVSTTSPYYYIRNAKDNGYVSVYQVDSSTYYLYSSTSGTYRRWSLSMNGESVVAQNYSYTSYYLAYGVTTDNVFIFAAMTAAPFALYFWKETTVPATQTHYTTTIPTYTVTYSVPSGVDQPDPETIVQGESLTLPAAPEGTPSGYTFLGWTTAQTGNATAQPATLTGEYTPNGSVTLYALYSYVQGSGSVEYNLVTAAPADWSGSYVITNNSTTTKYVLKGVTGSASGTNAESAANRSTLSASGITQNGNVLTNVTDAYVFTLTANGSYYTVKSASTGSYYGQNSSSYLFAYSALNGNNTNWTPAINANGAQLKCAANGSYPYFGFSTDNNYFWAASSNNANVLQLWKQTPVGTTYYTTNPGNGGNAVTQPNLSSDKADSSANLINLSANANAIPNPNPLGAGDVWVPTTTIDTSKEYLIGISDGSNVYLLANHNGSYYNYSYTGSTATYYYLYTGTATLDGNNVIGVTGAQTSLDNCKWKFGSSTGGVITNQFDTSYKLYYYTSGVSSSGTTFYQLYNDTSGYSSTYNSSYNTIRFGSNYLGLVSIGGVDYGCVLSSAPSTSVILYTKATNYTVSYNANASDATGTMADQTLTAGSGTLTANAFTRSGYTFAGWNTAADGTGAAASDRANVMVTANLTLYAQWVKTPGSGETVTYELATTLTAGEDYVVVIGNYAVGNTTVTGGHYLNAQSVTVNSNNNTITVPASAASSVLWHATGSTSGWSFYNPSASGFIGLDSGYYLSIESNVGRAWTYDGTDLNNNCVDDGNKVTDTSSSYYGSYYYYLAARSPASTGFTTTASSGNNVKFYKRVITAAATTYTVTVASGITNGSVSASPTTAAAGATITLAVSPNTGYEIGTVTYTPAGGSAVTISPVNGVYSFQMPAANVTVSATFTASATPDPGITTIERWVPVNNVENGEDYLIGFVLDGTTYLGLNYSPNSTSHYYYSFKFYTDNIQSSRSSYLGYTGTPIFDGVNITGVEGNTTNLEHATWTFNATNGGYYVVSKNNSNRYLYAMKGGSSSSGTNSYYWDQYPRTTANVWTWDATNHHLYNTTNSVYAGVFTLSNGVYMSCEAANDPNYTDYIYVQLYKKEIINVYNVTVNPAENGTVRANKSTATAGETVKLTLTPSEGYQVASVTVTDSNGATVPVTGTSGSFTFTMPASNVTVSATFTNVIPDNVWIVSFVDEDGKDIPGMNDIYVPKNTPNNLPESALPDPAKEEHYFLGWYQGDVKCTFPMTVNSDIVLTPKYSPMYAYDYTLTLRAVYGPYNPDATTHIYWYANNGTDAHNGAGERYTSKYTVTEGGMTTTTTKLPINAQVDIPLPTGNAASQTVFVGDNGGALTWEDHVFLGWARVDNGGTADAAEAQILTPDDIYLKWTGTEYVVRNDDGTYSPFSSQKVYADETTPYHDMYAVWAGFYYIYHSSDGTLEAVQVPYDVRDTKDLVAEAESKGCLYGGYYRTSGAVVSVDAAEMRTAKDSILNAQNFWNYTDSCVASGSVTETSLTDEGAVVYNGTSIKHTVDHVTVPFWQKAQAYTELGTELAPTAGTVYYLKEVPKTFLPNRLVYVKADKNTQLYDGTPIEEGELTSLYLLTAVDDMNYSANGFMVGTAHTGQNVSTPDANSGPADTVSRVFTIFVKNGVTYSYNANALNPSIVVPEGMNPNLVGFVAAKHLDYDWIQAHRGQTTDTATFYLKPYWTTLDGVTVTQDNIKGVNITADGKGISFVNVQ